MTQETGLSRLEMYSDKSPEKSLDCPSYVAKPGADLFGMISENGKVTYLNEAIRIDKTFVEETQKGRPAEERFRFSGKCIQHGCHQWEDGKCGLIQKVIQLHQNPPSAFIQHCAIRHTCRWYAQEKELACANCSEVFRNSEMVFLQSL
ncbi:hypothetical protein [Dyadobacter sp. CY356]|uniref:hypothetical protein n=1 Tax=Dyadobacter sp. CY356 TaxID=2906442 RepID=UPI001F4158D9|nr:hypothetical protein [Dyadobacter sp. CY356]MCF0054651.1 hypothetical protein [Dyadobacter sp. CY356]